MRYKHIHSGTVSDVSIVSVSRNLATLARNFVLELTFPMSFRAMSSPVVLVQFTSKYVTEHFSFTTTLDLEVGKVSYFLFGTKQVTFCLA